MWRLTEKTHKTQHRVVLIDRFYYSQRYRVITLKEEIDEIDKVESRRN